MKTDQNGHRLCTMHMSQTKNFHPYRSLGDKGSLLVLGGVYWEGRTPKSFSTSQCLHMHLNVNIVTVLWRVEGYTMKYCLSPREILRAQPLGFPKGSGNFSSYTPTQVTIQSFSITSTSQFFLVLTPWACNIFSYWLVEDSAMAALKVH